MKEKPKLTYTLLGEGYAEYAFIEVYLKRVFEQKNSNRQPVSSRLMRPSGGKSSSSKVLANLNKLCQNSFIDRKDIELFIAGVDLDKPDFDEDLPIYQTKAKEMELKLEKLYTSFKNKIILFVPIQAIDYWILYQHYQCAKNEARPVNHSLESKNKDSVKKELYGITNPNSVQIERVTNDVATKADFDELAKQSKSFKLFHNQVKSFIEAL